MAQYEISGSAVNERIDWRTRVLPGRLTGRRAESFPRDPNRYVVKGVRGPEGIVIEGFLEGANHAAIASACETYADMMADTSTKTVSIYGRSISGMDLANFETIGGPQTARDPSSGSVVLWQRVRFTWEKTTP